MEPGSVIERVVRVIGVTRLRNADLCCVCVCDSDGRRWRLGPTKGTRFDLNSHLWKRQELPDFVRPGALLQVYGIVVERDAYQDDVEVAPDGLTLASEADEFTEDPCLWFDDEAGAVDDDELAYVFGGKLIRKSSSHRPHCTADNFPEQSIAMWRPGDGTLVKHQGQAAYRFRWGGPGGGHADVSLLPDLTLYTSTFPDSVKLENGLPTRLGPDWIVGFTLVRNYPYERETGPAKHYVRIGSISYSPPTEEWTGSIDPGAWMAPDDECGEPADAGEDAPAGAYDTWFNWLQFLAYATVREDAMNMRLASRTLAKRGKVYAGQFARIIDHLNVDDSPAGWESSRLHAIEHARIRIADQTLNDLPLVALAYLEGNMGFVERYSELFDHGERKRRNASRACKILCGLQNAPIYERG